MSILEVLGLGPNRFQPDPNYNDHNNPKYRLNQQFLSFLVGVTALGLPFVLILVWVAGYLEIAPKICFYDSISHFYYTQFWGDVFVVALAFIAAFLIAYRGESCLENGLATIASIGALGVALFPTADSGCDGRLPLPGKALTESDLSLLNGAAEPITASTLGDLFMHLPEENLDGFFALFQGAYVLHFVGAVMLFGFIAYYTLFVFTRIIEKEHCVNGKLTFSKYWRNRIYRVSGIVIVVSSIAIVVGAFNEDWAFWNRYNLTFWFEALALWAFGVSWMIKGRFFRLLRSDLLLDERDKIRQ